MKRSRTWLSAAMVMLTSSLVDMGISSAFSPASDILASQNAERRRNVRSGDGRISEDNTNQWITVSGTDLNVALSPGIIGIYEGPVIGGGKKPKSRENAIQHQQTKASPDSLALSLDKAHRNSRLLRSKSHNTPFNGWPVQGKVCYTIVSGKVVYTGDHLKGRGEKK